MKKQQTKQDREETIVKVSKNGPYLVPKNIPIIEQFIMPNETGEITEYREGRTYSKTQRAVALCRCGQSKNKPFCDGSHTYEPFDGPSQASHSPILENTSMYQGPNFTLVDNEMYCAFARFCNAFGKVWNLVKQGNASTDLLALKEVKLCPSGRLMIIDNQTGEIIEDDDENSIQVLEDPMIGISGPLALRGRILVEDENGKTYERRNRQTLCRCGKSTNKPFCDGTHASHIIKTPEE